MSVEHVVFLVEELSMEVFLSALLPKLLGGLSFEIITFQCKDDLLKKLPQRLAGYARWLPPTHRLVIMVDRDDDACWELKAHLESVATKAGLRSRTASPQQWQIVNRIVIEELESWYFGDWAAVREAYPRVAARVTEKAGMRDPDAIAGGTWEAFERAMQKAGYFSSGLRKIEAARAIAPRLRPEKNRSKSFAAFRSALLELSGG